MTQRVLVCGGSVALAGIETSLSLDPGCEVLGHASPIDRIAAVIMAFRLK